MNRGFTLIEVLLAILIGGLVLTSLYGVFGSVSTVSQRLEAEGEQYHKVRILFDRIGGELGSLRFDRVGSDAALAAGTDADGSPYLEFNTELVAPGLQRFGGLSRVRYELREEDDGATLYRSERILLANLAEEEALPFVGGLKNFKIRYYGNGSWQDQWLSQSLPQMIEFYFELDSEGHQVPFRSSFVIPGGQG